MGQVRSLASGKVLFVATDSKGTSKAIFRLLAKECPAKRVLLINSETSGGECEREFIQTPDLVLNRGDYDLIICSPSVATGVSIEAPGIVHAVYGIFTGTSGTDADLAQALGRVREPVQRIVWCAKRGSNFSQVSRTTNSTELKSHLRQKSTTTIRLIRSGLKEDMMDGWGAYDWNDDPHLELYCQMAAAQNFAMHNLREALLVRLKVEGNQVTVENRETDAVTKLLLANARQEQREMDAEDLVRVEDLTYLEVQALEQKEGVSPEEGKAISKFYFKDFYCLEAITSDDVLWDKDGRRRGEILNLEEQLLRGRAIDRAIKALERQAAWNQGLCPWDISHAELRRRIRAELGFDELLEKMRNGWQWTRYDLAFYAAKARAMAAQIKVALNFTIPDVSIGDKGYMSDVQIIHQLLSQLGILVRQARWSRSVPGHEGEKLRVYELDTEHWEKVWSIIQRRELKRQQFHLSQSEEPSQTGSPPLFRLKELMGDPGSDPQWFLPETLAEVSSWLESASNQPSVRNEIWKFVPEAVVQFVENQRNLVPESPPPVTLGNGV